MTKPTYNIKDVLRDAVANNLELASEELVASRNQICDSCDVQHKLTHVCTACGCFLPLKTRLLKSNCPMELWPTQNDDTN